MSKFITILYFLQSVGTSAFGATSIDCSSGTQKMKVQFSFASNPVNFSVSTTFNDQVFPPYVFLNATTACGQALSNSNSCQTSETTNFGYDFSFSCSDGRRGSLHYEDGAVMGYCYNADGSLANQRGSDNCSIKF